MKTGDLLGDWVYGIVLRRRAKRNRLKQAETDLVRLADALNQFAMLTEEVVGREAQGAQGRLDWKAADRARHKHVALRALRESVAPIIDRLDP